MEQNRVKIPTGISTKVKRQGDAAYLKILVEIPRHLNPKAKQLIADFAKED